MTEEERIYQEALAKALDAARAGEGELAPVYRRISARIKARIRKRGDDVTIFELQREIDEAFAADFQKRIVLIEDAVGKAGRVGPPAAKRTAELVAQTQVHAQIAATPRAVSSASRRIAARTSARSSVPISTRIRRWDQKLGSEMAREVDRGIKQGRGIIGAAREIQKLDTGLEVRLPLYLKEVEAAARAGNIDELKVLTKRYTARAKKLLGEIQVDGTRKASAYSLRSATLRFLKDVEKARGNGIDKVVNRYVEDRAQYQARLIARHESVEAFRESYVRESRDKPGVVGYRWQLSSRHKVPDECDIFARQNAHDMGPGVYPADYIPRRHPACLCSIVAVVDREHFRRPANDALPRDKTSPGAEDWLRQNEGLAQQILGPTRWAAFKSGLSVLDAEGRPRLVRDILAGGRAQRMRVVGGMEE